MGYINCFLLTYAPQATMSQFMSLDLEGAEMLVLELIDFNQIIFGIMYIKANEQKPLMKNLAMTVLLEDKGYSFIGQ